MGDDADLVRSSLRGDKQAFCGLVERYQASLYRFLVALTGGNRAAAEDLVQETFLRVYQHLGRYDQGRKFSTWLFAIARNLAIDEVKRQRPVSFTSLSDEEGRTEWVENLHCDDRTPLELCLESEEQAMVFAALSRLPTEYREVIVLRYFEGLEYGEIGHVLDVPITTVKIRIFRAKKRLLEILGPPAAPPAGEEV